MDVRWYRDVDVMNHDLGYCNKLYLHAPARQESTSPTSCPATNLLVSTIT